MKYKKWSIFRANLEPVIGSEQGKSRPVLIISEDITNDNLNIVNVLPLTSHKKGRIIYPNEVILKKSVTQLPNDSIVLCYQIRTIDKKRLNKFYIKIEDEFLQEEINEALRFQLGL
ncbi:MAG: type II toxin-antitoxin system PemK/MazF family toxin [Chitinophagales bacterium]|nr:type II toxin-antitoxin system PemK/MazF family toxin [Bacteroidota bacterium]